MEIVNLKEHQLFLIFLSKLWPMCYNKVACYTVTCRKIENCFIKYYYFGMDDVFDSHVIYYAIWNKLVTHPRRIYTNH